MSDDAKLPAVPELRDRVTAILSIRFALTPDEEWLARTLLAALDTIDRLEGENQRLMGVAAQFVDERREALDTIDRLEAEKEALVRELYIETGIWRGQALNGGNESGDDR